MKSLIVLFEATSAVNMHISDHTVNGSYILVERQGIREHVIKSFGHHATYVKSYNNAIRNWFVRYKLGEIHLTSCSLDLTWAGRVFLFHFIIVLVNLYELAIILSLENV